MTCEHAAAVAIAGCMALQVVRDSGKLDAAQLMVVSGVSGGAGTLAVQIAMALGATITAVCGTPNVEMVRSIGADSVIDYASAPSARFSGP